DPCNLRKANRVDMRPLRMPSEPTSHELISAKRAFPPNYLHESWLDYLYWDSERESEDSAASLQRMRSSACVGEGSDLDRTGGHARLNSGKRALIALIAILSLSSRLPLIVTEGSARRSSSALQRSNIRWRAA